MPTDAEQLATIKSQILANLVLITNKPRPDYDLDGQEIDWEPHRKGLIADLAVVNAEINANSPYEIHSQGSPL